MSYWDQVAAGTAGSGWSMGQAVPGASAATGLPAAFSYTPGQALPADVIKYLQTAQPKVGGALQSTNGYTFAPTFAGGAASAANGDTRGEFAGVGINDGKPWYQGQNEYKYNADGTYGGFNPILDPTKRDWVDKYGPYIPLMFVGGAAALAGAGAGAGAAGAGAAGGGGAAGAGAVGGAGGFVGEGALSGVGAWDGALAGATAGDAAAGTAALGAGSSELGSAGSSVFNPAVDSQLASEQLGITGAQAGADAAAAGIPSVSIPGSGISSALNSLGVTPQQLASNPGLMQQIASKLGMDASTLTSLIGPAASIGSALIGSSAAKSAADTQAAAADKAAALNEPFRQAGIAANNKLMQVLGVGGDPNAANYGSEAKNFGAADFTADPGYQFRLDQGQTALERQLSAGGSLYSGKALKDMNNYVQGQASQEFGNAYNRYNTNRSAILNPLQSMAGAGQTAANTIGNYTTQAGNAQAAGTVGSANAIGNGLTGAYGTYQQNQLMNMLLQNQQKTQNQSIYQPL